MKRALILFVLPVLFWTAPAFALCINPAATEGDIIYNTDYGVHQYCNGTAWMAFGALNPGAGGSGCNVPTGIAGELIYNSANHVLQYCDGDDWRAVGGTVVTVSGLSGPAGCPAIGDKCADTTIFAGFHPMTQDHLFIPPTDQDGGSGVQWKNATGTNDINPDSFVDGRINHANRSGAIADFPAFKVCEDLGAGGQTDWYLPSRVELYYLWSVRGTIQAGGNITNFQNTYYWSSTEASTHEAWMENFNDGGQYRDIKTEAYRVRCVRR